MKIEYYQHDINFCFNGGMLLNQFNHPSNVCFGFTIDKRSNIETAICFWKVKSIKMTTFPRNPALSLKLMDIAIELESIQSESMFAEQIREGVRTGRVVQAVKEIYEQREHQLTADIVGYKTLNKIIEFYESDMH